ncbi:MAG: hypothetical protein ACYCS0_00800 [bacterium]
MVEPVIMQVAPLYRVMDELLIFLIVPAKEYVPLAGLTMAGPPLTKVNTGFTSIDNRLAPKTVAGILNVINAMTNSLIKNLFFANIIILLLSY